MKNKVNIDDFLVVLFWIKTFLWFEKKPFDFELLMDQAVTYKYNNTPLDTKIHPIDDVMIVAYHIYTKIKSTRNEVVDVLDQLRVSTLNKHNMFKQADQFENIFEDLIENYKYDDPEIRGIQKGFLAEKMKEYAKSEDYERAAKVRDMIKEC
jgi:hypothetical protein